MRNMRENIPCLSIHKSRMPLDVQYNAGLTAGSLKVAESRVVADLLLREATDAEWNTTIYDDNAMQVRNRQTARRLVILLRERLLTMPSDLWKLVLDGNKNVATHACLAAAIRHSVLLADFMQLVLRDQYRIFAKQLPPAVWDDFLADCAARDATVNDWTESTVRRLRSSVFQILAQAGYVDNTRSLRLQTVYVEQDVIRCLTRHHEEFVLGCMQISS